MRTSSMLINTAATATTTTTTYTIASRVDDVDEMRPPQSTPVTL